MRIAAAVIASLTIARRHARLMRLIPHAPEFLPLVQRLRPARGWQKVTAAVNAALPREKKPYTRDRLVRSVRLLVREGMADKALLGSAPKLGRRRKASSVRAAELAAAFKSGRPKATLAEVTAELTRMKVLPPSGGAWALSSVKALLDRARSLGG